MKKTLLKFFLSSLLSLLFIPHSQAVVIKNSARIMTYNIRNAKGMDGNTDIQRIADIINKNTPEIVALQEIDSATHRSGNVDLLQELELKTAMYGTYAPAIDYDGGKYGIGLLSKQKVEKITRIPLPGKEEKRVLLMAEFKDYVIACTHLSLTLADRVASMAIIRENLKNINKPVFFAGDLNAGSESDLIKDMQSDFMLFNDTKINTFPSKGPDHCLDYIAGYKGNGQIYSIIRRGVIADSIASDHRPVYAEVNWAVPSEKIFWTKPYLQNPVDNGITITWLTNVPVYSWVEYGTDKNNLKKAHTLVDGQVISNNTLHKIRLNDLEPGKTYYYKVYSREILSYQAYSKTFGNTAESDFSSFALPTSDTKDFTAVIFNDLHKRNDVLQALCDQVKDIPYDFAIFNGDCIDDPANEQQAVSFIKAINEIIGADRIPVFYLRGNHEIRNAYSIELRSLFDYVDDKTYNAFSWGDTRFIQLDCGEDKPDDHWVYYGLNDFTGLRQDQVKFLEKELKSKEFKKAKKRVLVHHIPIYGMREESFNPCYDLWNPLLQKQPINVAINGHTHRYAFHEKNTVDNPFPVIIGGAPHMERGTIAVVQKKGDKLTVKVIAANGEVKLDREF